jgi:TrmH family RNA methyltransferase
MIRAGWGRKIVVNLHGSWYESSSTPPTHGHAGRLAHVDLLTARSARVKDARQLTVGKHRRSRHEFLAEGPQAVREALRADVVVELFVEQDASERRADEISGARASGVPIHLVDHGGFRGLVGAQTPQGVVARCRWEPVSLRRVLEDPGPGQIAIAHEMADPGNAGALIRVADAAGARGVALSDKSVDPTNPKCVRATAGSLFHLPVLPAGTTRTILEAVRAAGYRVVAADVTSASVDLFEAEDAGLLAGRIAWVFGNEAHGLPDDVLASVDDVVRIPILGRAESLNLATAAAICMYSAARAARIGTTQ